MERRPTGQSDATMEHMTQEVTGGHMPYRKCIVGSNGGHQFIKQWQPIDGHTPAWVDHARLYLEKEAAVYMQLATQGYQHIPAHAYDATTNCLQLEALRPENGWHWRAPHDATDRYIADAFAALDALPDISADHPEIRASHDTLLKEGWGDMASRKAAIMARLEAAADLRAIIGAHRYITAYLQTTEPTRLTHHDCRQSNIAWHPQHGAYLVDWSWASTGLTDADHTALLIDLHKYGHDVAPYLARFNPVHALLLIGFWLSHSTYPAGPDPRVREQQIASSIAACELLRRTSPLLDVLIKLPEGRGQLWHDGANPTADTILITNEPTPRILMVQRRDTGQWALPGGFVDDGESSITAARRELQEETGLLAPNEEPAVIYHGLVADPRSTRQSWPSTTACLWRVDAPQTAQAGDDATNATWLPVNSLKVSELYGSHYWLIQRALGRQPVDQPTALASHHATPAAQSPTESAPESPQSHT